MCSGYPEAKPGHETGRGHPGWEGGMGRRAGADGDGAQGRAAAGSTRVGHTTANATAGTRLPGGGVIRSSPVLPWGGIPHGHVAAPWPGYLG